MPYTRAPYTHARGAPHVLDLDGEIRVTLTLTLALIPTLALTLTSGAPHVLDLDGDGVGGGEGPHDGEEVPHLRT